SPRDDFFGVRLPLSQTILQRLPRWRQDKDAHAGWHRPTHLPRALPVDFQHHATTLCELGLDRTAPGPIEVIENLCVFQKLALPDQLLELGDRNEVILASVLLRGTHLARGVGHGQAKVRSGLEKSLDERRLSRARGSGNDEKTARGVRG